MVKHKQRRVWIATTQAELAACLGRSLDTIKSWAKQGMPGKPGRYPIRAIFTWTFTIGPWESEQAKKDILAERISQQAAEVEDN